MSWKVTTGGQPELAWRKGGEVCELVPSSALPACQASGQAGRIIVIVFGLDPVVQQVPAQQN